MHEGVVSARARPGRLAGGRRGGDHRPRRAARRARRLAAARVPPVDGRLGRDHPLGQGPRHRRHRRGHAAPPAAHRRAGPRLRPGVQGQPAAAHAGGRRGAARRAWPTARSTSSPPTTPRTPVEDKDCEWAAAAFGMTGLETALAVVQQTMVDTGLLTGPTSPGGCRSARRASAGSPATGRPLAVGEPANLTLVDPAARWTVDADAHGVRQRNTPFRGLELPGRVVATFLRGRATVLDGAPGRAGAARWRVVKPPPVRRRGRSSLVDRARAAGALVLRRLARGARHGSRRRRRCPRCPASWPGERCAEPRRRASTSRRPRAGDWLDRVGAHGLGAGRAAVVPVLDGGRPGRARPARATCSCRRRDLAARAAPPGMAGKYVGARRARRRHLGAGAAELAAARRHRLRSARQDRAALLAAPST